MLDLRTVVAALILGGFAAGCAEDGDVGNVDTVAQAIGAAPVNQLPSPQTTNEDSPLFFSAIAGNALTMSDADNATLNVQVIVTSGTFTLGRTTGLSVSGNGTFSVTASGSITDLIAGLDGAAYRPAADFHGAATLQMNSSDSNGESDLDVLDVTVTAFNDPPVNGTPGPAQAATEDVPHAFSLSVTDVDVAGAALVVTLTASNATKITLPTIAGLAFTTGDGTADATMTFAGALPEINAALNGAVVTPPVDYIGSSTLTITSNDQGASGAGVAGSDTDSITITWAAVNDAPVNVVAGPYTIVEDTTLTFATGVDDVDASTALVQVTLTSTGGTLTLPNRGGLTFTSGDGVADATMTFHGTLVALDAALAETVYAPTANFAGAATVTMTSSDLGNSGSGGIRADTDVIGIQVTGVNDAPVNTVPTAQLTNEDIARVFSAATGNAITVADVDAGSLQITLAANPGTVTLGKTTSLTFQAGDGVADATTTFTGTVSAINAALNGTSYAPPANYHGAAALTVSTSDLGATGTGGALTDDDTIAITVTSINDAPTAINDGLVIAEDAAATVVAVLSNDTAAPDAGETLTVTAVGAPLHGTATTNGTTVTYQPAANYHGPDSLGYTISDGNGGTATATLAVTVTSVNDAPTAAGDTVSVVADSVGNALVVLSNDSGSPDVGETLTITAVTAPANGTAQITDAGTRISYTPAAGYAGPDAFSYTIGDGNGASASATVTVAVETVITKPVNTLPGPQTIVEDSPLVFSAAAGNPIRVADANNTTLTVQILVAGGTFTLTSTTSLSVTGNGTSAVTASGDVTTLNTRLDGAKFMPTTDFHGAASLTLNTSDTSGESDLDVLNVAVTSFNDAPVNAAPTATQAATEDLPRTFSTISVSDVDLSGAELVITLTANNATTISLASTSGLTFSTGDGATDPTMTFAGALSAVNVALNGVTITPPANYIGPSSLVIVSNDQGGTGAGVVGEDTNTVSLSWTAVNDPPVNTVPGAQATTEETALTFASWASNALTVSDADVAAGALQITLSASAGTLDLGAPGGVLFTVGDGSADPTMTFRGTAAELNAALEGTRYTPAVNATATATVTMVSNDLGNTGGPARSDTDTIQVAIAAVNDAPEVTVPGALVTNEDISRVMSAAQGNPVTVADVDATALQVSLFASAGALTLSRTTGLTFQTGDGTADPTVTFIGTTAAINAALNGLTFLPTPQYSGTASFAISVNDLGAAGAGGPLSAEDAVAVTILAVNDPPDAIADAVATTEDIAEVMVDVLANDTFAPDVGEVLELTAVSTPARGTAVRVGDLVRYTPNANYAGVDSFTYTIGDGNGATDTATVTVTMAASNDPPTATADTFTVAESSTSNVLAVRANDSSAPDATETLTVIAVTTPAHGTATIASGSVNYVPTTGYHGADAFTYTLSDGSLTAVATVSITVTSVDTQPVAVDDVLSVAEDVAGTIAVITNDTGKGDAPLTVAITTPPAHGTTTVLADLSVRYTPAADYHGADGFGYTLTDEDGDVDTGAVVVTVGSTDDVPVAVGDTAAVEEDGAVEIDVLGNDSALGDGPVVVTIVAAPAAGIATVASSGVVTYTPAPDATGDDELTYRVRDVDGDLATAVVVVTVTPVNDAPAAAADTAATRDGEAVTIAVLDNDTDVDGDALTVTAVTAPAHGVATVEGAAVRYVPAAGYTGTDQLTYTIADGDGVTATAAVVIGVGLDGDGDGLLDADELGVHGTDPASADSDDDGLADGVEVMSGGTDPLDDDSDDDGLLDGSETTTSPMLADSDDDGLADGLELGLTAPEGDDTGAGFTADADPSSTTDPTESDTDGGGLADGVEDADHDGKLDAGETDPNDASDDADVPDPEDPPAAGGCSASGGTSSAGALLLIALAALLNRRRKH